MTASDLTQRERSIRRTMLNGRQAGRWALAALGVLALAAAWVWPLPSWSAHSFAGHMLQHLLTMNGGALLLALAGMPPLLARRVARPRSAATGSIHRPARVLALVTGLQVTLLYLWHLPAIYTATHGSEILTIAMQGSLFAIALAFWHFIAAQRIALWVRIACLLATGKLFCLLGAIYVFARRPLYGLTGGHMDALADQQLAGLLMVSACALIYVAAAISLFVAWIGAPHRPLPTARHAKAVAS